MIVSCYELKTSYNTLIQVPEKYHLLDTHFTRLNLLQYFIQLVIFPGICIIVYKFQHIVSVIIINIGSIISMFMLEVIVELHGIMSAYFQQHIHIYNIYSMFKIC